MVRKGHFIAPIKANQPEYERRIAQLLKEASRSAKPNDGS